jgi:predicted RNase H-like HicB family nuclease
MTEYLVILERGDTGWGGWSPDLGVYATGDTEDETIKRMREAIAFHVEGLRQAGDAVPEPTTRGVLVGA